MHTCKNRLGEAVLTSTHKLYFQQKYEKYQSFLSENFPFLEVKFSIYLNRHVFLMNGVFTIRLSRKRPFFTSEGICLLYGEWIHLQDFPPYRINPPIRRFVYKTGAVFGPFPGRILLLLNYKTG